MMYLMSCCILPDFSLCGLSCTISEAITIMYAQNGSTLVHSESLASQNFKLSPLGYINWPFKLLPNIYGGYQSLIASKQPV